MKSKWTFSGGLTTGVLIADFTMILGIATKWWIGLIVFLVLYFATEIISIFAEEDTDYDY